MKKQILLIIKRILLQCVCGVDNEHDGWMDGWMGMMVLGSGCLDLGDDDDDDCAKSVILIHSFIHSPHMYLMHMFILSFLSQPSIPFTNSQHFFSLFC